MSKYVKGLLTDEIGKQLEGVQDALLVNISGMTANDNSALRVQLRKKDIRMTMVKNSLVRRASEGTPLSAAFMGLEGSTAVVWGGEDIVGLAKEVMRLTKEKSFAKFEPKGGVLDGAALTAGDIEKVSKWPSRGEQLSLLLGQILSPGANLVSQLLSPGGALASQIEQKGEEGEADNAAPAAAEETPAEA
jgi:large subunit ribosomal protein L10